MTVAVDDIKRYQWPVSTGNPSHETPNGSFRTFRMEEDHYSKEFDDAPMPHAIFFTKSGHAIHGTDSVARLGSPASHGCVRLSRENAATLFALVQSEGVLNTTVELSGSSKVALARNRQPDRAYDAVSNPVEQAQSSVALGRGGQLRIRETHTSPLQPTSQTYRKPRSFFSFQDRAAAANPRFKLNDDAAFAPIWCTDDNVRVATLMTDSLSYGLAIRHSISAPNGRVKMN